MFKVLCFALDFDFEDDAPDFLESGGFDDGGRTLFCDMSP